ncbi:site-specific DNA-methyltransferase [Croceicoccus gelatinilyticus]|uniref:site-specific DNA-methyltransferase n=1 Tax=Croceicoccus gelatinilyticus TaxID=2835536 RepID=UPI001BCB0269|nr:site-specific DNA-methyltransferase [Croceicoccus gelatinilyticus]MBS7671410.1 site-specific DNA-methyltransferase [Croceicoccus gelatinilyticus]
MNADRIVEIGPAKLILGDAYKVRADIGWVDAEIIDPPYLIKTAGAGKFRKARPYLDQIKEVGIDQGFDISIINTMLTGSVCCFCHNDQIPKITSYLQNTFDRFVLGFWAKRNPIPVANKHLMPDCEVYVRAWQKEWHPVGELANKRRVIEDTEIEEPAIVGTREKVFPSKTYGHPTVKPEKVMDTIMSTTKGESVLDVFMGTGSTGVSALKHGKRFIGVEKNPEYFEIAIARLEQAARELDAAA